MRIVCCFPGWFLTLQKSYNMRLMLALLMVPPIISCAPSVYRPGPGMAAQNFGPDSARCRLFARGTAPDFAFGASGSSRFVAAASVGAALGSAIGTAVHENAAFNDCLQARGWLLASGDEANRTGPMGATLSPAFATAPAMAPVPLPVAAVNIAEPVSVLPAMPRRNLGLVVLPMTPPLASSVALGRPEGLFVVEVQTEGAARSAGLMANDVVLAFGTRQMMTVSDLQAALGEVSHGSAMPVTIWRGGHQQIASLNF
jgi:hypothetical protein